MDEMLKNGLWLPVLIPLFRKFLARNLLRFFLIIYRLRPLSFLTPGSTNTVFKVLFNKGFYKFYKRFLTIYIYFIFSFELLSTPQTGLSKKCKMRQIEETPGKTTNLKNGAPPFSGMIG